MQRAQRALGLNQPGNQRPPAAPMIGNTKQVALWGDDDYIKLFERCKREAFADRWVWERQWTRVIHYLNFRQWLAPYSRTEGWRDARISKGVPRPCTSKPKEIDQAIRSMFSSIKFGVLARPVADTPTAIATSDNVSNLAPILHDVHDMDTVMDEADFWFVNLGNVCLHTYWDENMVNGMLDIPYETCTQCGGEFRVDAIYQNKQRCLNCQSRFLIPTLNMDGTPKTDQAPKGAPATVALSPFEYAFPLQRARWRDVPFVIRMRWRVRSEYEENPALQPYVDEIQWQKGSSERSLQIFQSLALQNDIPASRSSAWGASGTISSTQEEGVAEYQLWMRPTPEHPEGLVCTFAQDNTPIVIHNEENESTPGPLPYRDGKGNPLFTFHHAAYQKVGGRVIGNGVHEPVIQKYDQRNRFESLIEMIAMRMASPQWMLAKGTDVQWLGNSPGVPGLILQWNAQVAGQYGRPERVAGMPPDPALVSILKKIDDDIDEGTGVYSILRGDRPTGVEGFSAMQLLVESGQRRFASAFQARGWMYKQWLIYAVEMERQYGPDDRTVAVEGPYRSWTFVTWKKSDLKGDTIIMIEDGTYTPKTALGERAAIEHLNQLQFLDHTDQDQRQVIFQKFGMSGLIPTLNAHVQAAQKKQQDFVDWIKAGKFMQVDTTEPSAIGQIPADVTRTPGYPLIWRRWFDPQIHRQEFIKWANSSIAQNLLADYPPIAGLIEAHIMEIDQAIAEKQAGIIDPAGQADAGALQPPEPQPPMGQPPAGSPMPGAPIGGALHTGAPFVHPPAPGGRPPMPARPGIKPRGAGLAMHNSNRNSAPVNVLPGVPPNPSVTPSTIQ